MAKTNHSFGTLAAVGMLMLVVVQARPAEATFPGKHGKIAYMRHDGNDYEIYTINPPEGRPSTSPTTIPPTSILPGEGSSGSSFRSPEE